tara:strand:- start:4149 stop:6593 length:2445 start_codon:yes stop_codon:yes gene_type:complete
MVKNKKLLMKHSDLISFISETVISLCNKKILEEQVTYLKVIPSADPIKSYVGTKEEALKAWENLSQETKNTLTSAGIKPFTVIPHSTYEGLRVDIQRFLYGYLYPFKTTNEFLNNNALAQGDTLYQYIPGIKHIMLGEVKVCVNRKTGKKVNCDTGLALDGSHEEEGFEVDDSQVILKNLFAYEGSAKMNTKYFCRAYLIGDKEIPETVRPKVLKYLQKAYAAKTGKNLGVNKKDWYSGEEQTYNQLAKKLEETNNWDILVLVSDYLKDYINEKERVYNSGKPVFMVGTDKSTAVPLSPEQHKNHFKAIRNFADLLLKTNCGFGVGEKALSVEEEFVREKFGDVFAFIKERPDNWEEMDTQEQDEWLKKNKSKVEREMTIEEQDEVQFWWDMFSLALAVVGTILVATGVGAPIGVGLIYASVGTGVASGIFDLYQGQTAMGAISIGLEVVPFLKVMKMAKPLAKFSDDKIAKMVAYGLKNGKTATLKRFPKGGKALYEALKQNGDEMLKALDAQTSESIKFLKRFSTLDAVEFDIFKRLNPQFKQAMGGKTFNQFSKELDEVAEMLFANRNAWRTFIGKTKYNLSVPFKMIAASLAATSVSATWNCFDVAVTDTKGTKKDLEGWGKVTGLAKAGFVDGIDVYIDEGKVVSNQSCTLWALLFKNLFSKDLIRKQELENKISQKIGGDVEIKETDSGMVISISNLEGEEIPIADTPTIINTIIGDISQLEDTYKAYIESRTDDEEILEFILFELGNGDIEKGEKAFDDLLEGVKNENPESIDRLFELLDKDVAKVFRNKKEEIDARLEQKLSEYGI